MLAMEESVVNWLKVHCYDLHKILYEKLNSLAAEKPQELEEAIDKAAATQETLKSGDRQRLKQSLDKARKITNDTQKVQFWLEQIKNWGPHILLFVRSHIS